MDAQMCDVLICPVQAHYFSLYRRTRRQSLNVSYFLTNTKWHYKKKMSIYWQKKSHCIYWLLYWLFKGKSGHSTMNCPLGGRILVKMIMGFSPGLFGSTVVTERAAGHFLCVFFNLTSFPHLCQVDIVQARGVKWCRCIFTDTSFGFFVLYHLPHPTTLFCIISLYFLRSQCLTWLFPLLCCSVSSFAFFISQIHPFFFPYISTSIYRSDIFWWYH